MSEPPNGTSVGSAIFPGLMSVTNRQTYTQTYHTTPSVACVLCNACKAA